MCQRDAAKSRTIPCLKEKVFLFYTFIVIHLQVVTIIGEILKACKGKEKKKGAHSLSVGGRKDAMKTMKYRQSSVQTEGK